MDIEDLDNQMLEKINRKLSKYGHRVERITSPTKALDMDTRKTLANARVEQRIQDELDDLKRYRRAMKGLTGLTVPAAVGTIFLWYMVLSWGITGMNEPGVDKGAVVFVSVIGLVVLTVIVGFGTIGSIMEWFETNTQIRVKERRLRDHYLYMDA